MYSTNRFLGKALALFITTSSLTECAAVMEKPAQRMNISGSDYKAKKEHLRLHLLQNPPKDPTFGLLMRAFYESMPANQSEATPSRLADSTEKNIALTQYQIDNGIMDREKGENQIRRLQGDLVKFLKEDDSRNTEAQKRIKARRAKIEEARAEQGRLIQISAANREQREAQKAQAQLALPQKLANAQAAAAQYAADQAFSQLMIEEEATLAAQGAADDARQAKLNLEWEHRQEKSSKGPKKVPKGQRGRRHKD